MILNFGPLLEKREIEQSIVDELLERGSKLQANARSRLAGHIDKELFYEKEDRDWFKQEAFQYFHAHITALQEQWLPDMKKVRSWELPNLWINYMKAGEYNPPHVHSGELSFVIYLKVPKEIEGDARVYGAAHPGPGAIDFLYGQPTMHHKTHITAFPRARDIFIFPANLLHTVSPFRCEGERISVSGNLFFNHA